jgi:hypothetical protein
MKFDDVLESSVGKKYYKDIYKKNEISYHPYPDKGTE